MNIPVKAPQPASLDSQNHLVLPPEILQDFGLEPGAQLSLRITPEGVVLRPPLSQLRKVHIEPTRKTASATPSRLAAAVCGRRALFSAHKRLQSQEALQLPVQNLPILDSRKEK